ncbi:hypothetical protein A3A46_01395 [Candidatus Roizmanbacteria bacterium RIFCSPLOWO2_01_FULL_37_13]|uniref:Diaminopimelate epimerase n=1 Tax=Candidatus Roizmanbacteria bacterium RIFCSPHIGHO2_02_FULL_38_11 TaxID=1802039 RepID=A0A1F7H0E1_9BACT|nr:MAG: hypothetical protein A3C25_01695 [Candidatus Roizmanbacteria bacterium RIFCSPHIGHO2_02_FULL_38_11]OGK35423.1 MAG: hypothetical protein A3F58_02765 [Candidatus Roizmanbacteria bacterium RIFCSPHIGHO2_12_FULL_37_9b]OGK42524.1 MAG: hypothetical protein A3A46_01395 [Candidatus Roizmanbacteria bacterium RIFCSPLOWO2_01_FULL_37_13]
MLKKFIISILQTAGGNDTAIVDGFVPKSLRKVLNDRIIKQFPNVEQCGFCEFKAKKDLVKFSMMGGEFSGNAILAITYAVLKGKNGGLNIKSSGSNKILKTGIRDNVVFSEIPIFKSFASVKQLNTNTFLVILKGINHLVVYKKISKNRIISAAERLLNQFDLIKYKCSGCIFVEIERSDVLKINPVVWIKNVKTLTYETSCGSGSVAVGLSKLKRSQKNQINLKIKQPSNNYIIVKAKKSKNSFLRVSIEGKVKLLMTNQNISL